MCNLYSMMRTRAEAASLVRAFEDGNNNQPPNPGVYPDYLAPVVVVCGDGQREVRDLHCQQIARTMFVKPLVKLSNSQHSLGIARYPGVFRKISMMRFVVGALLALAVPMTASAQYVNPYAQPARPPVYQAPAYQAPKISSAPVYQAPSYTAPAQGYGQISPTTDQPRTDYVHGYTRADGTVVQPYYRSHR
jgi:hypothetical protein